MIDVELPPLQALKGKRVALFGCGDIGVRLARQLIAAGALVHAYRRQPSTLPADIPATACDFAVPATMNGISQTTYDYAIITLTPNRHESDRAAAYRQGYLTNLSNILDALSLASLQKVFWVSSTSVYGQNDDSVVDETSATEPLGETGRILLQAEGLIRQLGDKGCIVRFSGIYRDTHRMISKLRAGELAAKVDQDYYSNRIHVVDCAGMLGFLLQQHSLGVALDKVYIGTDCTPVRYTDLVDWLAESLRLPLDKTSEAKKPAVGSKRLSNQRILDAGYTFVFPSFKEGMRAIAQQ
ncbi:Protein YeeZ [BD1-7 clade bacterium]|uniref:Protein YeeZ n=1 Tax=BD1-7 clade bacterium TaxID=2029982 RepID=A0A5S9QH69_9GAMM|nr:Protein YeeZ [BD1-7 clade bacterium]